MIIWHYLTGIGFVLCIGSILCLGWPSFKLSPRRVVGLIALYTLSVLLMVGCVAGLTRDWQRSQAQPHVPKVYTPDLEDHKPHNI